MGEDGFFCEQIFFHGDAGSLCQPVPLFGDESRCKGELLSEEVYGVQWPKQHADRQVVRYITDDRANDHGDEYSDGRDPPL